MTDPYNPYGQNPQQPSFNQGYGAGMPGAGGMMKPDNQLLWTILSTLLCCLPLGAVGIYYSLQVDKHWQMGAVAEAQDAAGKAKKFAIASAVVTVVGMILYFVVIFAIALSEQSSMSSY